MILVIDNYDSFTWNLVHYLQELGAEIEVVRNDAIGVGQAMSWGAEAFLISPGPCTPNEAGISLELVAACAEAKRPLLGKPPCRKRFRLGPRSAISTSSTKSSACSFTWAVDRAGVLARMQVTPSTIHGNLRTLPPSTRNHEGRYATRLARGLVLGFGPIQGFRFRSSNSDCPLRGS